MDNSVIVSLRDIVVEFDGQRILDGLNLDCLLYTSPSPRD